MPEAEVNPISICVPRNANVVIQRDKKPEKIGKIHLPDSHLRKQQTGTVIAVGPEVTDIKAGHRVIVNAWSGAEMHHGQNPEEFVLMDQKDVLGFIPDPQGK